MTRLLLDQALPRSAVELLSADGWDVVHAYQCDLSTARDEEILDYARREGRVVCTLDADFHSILAVTGAAYPSVVLREADVASLLKLVWNEVGESLQSGAAVTVTERAIRLRRLPMIAAQDRL